MPAVPRHAEVWPPLYGAAQAAVRAFATAVNGFELSGRRNIPRHGGCLVVCNHLADSDGMFVGAALPGPPRVVNHLVTARHHEGPPVVRRLLLHLGLEPMRTDGSEIGGLRHARSVLSNGGIVVIYPEGVPGYSAQVQAFARGAGWLALTPGAVVVPAGIWGSHRVMRGGLPVGRGPVRVAFGSPVGMEGFRGSPSARAADAAAVLRRRVQRLVSGLAAADPV
jgi:1-acyl-sn-glycerol-3-phosphate acyltransferase